MTLLVKNTFLIFLMFIGISCNSSDESSELRINSTQELPLLKTGKHLGIIIGFNHVNPVQTQDSIQKRWNEAIDNGMSIGRLQIDWTELEPQPNVFDKQLLKDKLEELSSNHLQVFLTIPAIDSEEAIPPSDLVGKPFDDTELISRFKKLMDWVIPMLIEHNGFLIAISNEADNSFGDFPERIPQTVTFVKEIRKHIHKIDSRMAITATMAEGSLDEDRQGLKDVLNECDIASINFYGQYNAGIVQDMVTVNKEIDELLDFVGDKLVIFQELGFSSGYEDGSSVMDSSPDKQKIFFNTFFERMQSEPKIRAAVIFQLVDWSPETTDLVSQVYVDEGLPDDFIFAYKESLRTVGLIRYENGFQKPAWNEFLKWTQKFKQ